MEDVVVAEIDPQSISLVSLLQRDENVRGVVLLEQSELLGQSRVGD